MSRLFRLTTALVFVAALAALAAFLLPAGSDSATAQAPNLGDLNDGMFFASGTCASDEIEITCSIESDPCGRSFSTTGCCANDEIPSCAPVISMSNPTCWMGFSISCN
jgi:hypothetical protein